MFVLFREGLVVGSGSTKELVGVASFVSAQGCEHRVPHVFARVSGKKMKAKVSEFRDKFFRIAGFVSWIDNKIATN